MKAPKVVGHPERVDVPFAHPGGVADVPGAFLDALLGAFVSFVASAVAFRVAMERRLGRLEADAERYPPKEGHERLRALENEVASLRPVKELLDQCGKEGATRAFGGKDRK